MRQRQCAGPSCNRPVRSKKAGSGSGSAAQPSSPGSRIAAIRKLPRLQACSPAAVRRQNHEEGHRAKPATLLSPHDVALDPTRQAASQCDGLLSSPGKMCRTASARQVSAAAAERRLLLAPRAAPHPPIFTGRSHGQLIDWARQTPPSLPHSKMAQLPSVPRLVATRAGSAQSVRIRLLRCSCTHASILQEDARQPD